MRATTAVTLELVTGGHRLEEELRLSNKGVFVSSSREPIHFLIDFRDRLYLTKLPDLSWFASGELT